ncbi:hypothetical protein NEMBOFW57_000309 [Staphylotrichum longicolle]|uniref:Fungal N-terminal domain-containing protein n=1 Tax=Staphylotrichum longicolle TaxID=669026 RepID=A0AAD4I1I9_9PEZI|nr:hypothetical protein NEMBOFW57_000309 [Staphylotrichum longicolle]
MDPITAVSTLGAVVGIIDVITKSISGLREVGARYKDAEFTVAALVSQLVTLRAALTKIREWMDSQPVESHYQLVLDLGDTLSFCGILTDKLESEVLRCNRSPRGLLKAQSKLKFAVGGKSIEDLQNMVLHQTNALNLVVAAYNLGPTEQRAFLESSRIRQVFNTTKDDVSSLYVHRDSASIATKLTDRLSLFSREFAFDRVLWVSKVYKDASPRLLEAMRERARQKEDEAERQRSRSIDQGLKRDAREAAKTVRVLLVDSSAFENIDRIIADDYFPTSQDALHAWACSKTIDETVLDYRGPKSPSVKVCSVSSHLLQSKTWTQQLASGASVIVFLVDITSYCRYSSLDDPTTTEMSDAMTLFKSIVNSHMGSSASPAVWFRNCRDFHTKAERSPVKNWFPDYTGGSDSGEAVRYFGDRFQALYDGYRDFFLLCSEAEDDRLVREFLSIAAHVRINEDLRVAKVIR